jgi:hypothetical protein
LYFPHMSCMSIPSHPPSFHCIQVMKFHFLSECITATQIWCDYVCW